jgi:hypothetical protein
MSDRREEYSTVVLAAAPVGYWPLRVDARDRSGYDHHGTFFGSPQFRSSSISGGLNGGWVELDGQSYIEITSVPEFSQTHSGEGLTIEVWMRPDQKQFAFPYVHWLGKGDHGRQEWGLRLYSIDHPTFPNRISGYVWNATGGEGSRG